jgi:HlyD family secretion protein
MKRKLLLIPVAIVVVLAVILLVYQSGWFSRRPENRIAFSGNIELTEVKVSFKTPGKIEELSLQEGDQVKQGEILARLDHTQLLRQRDSILASSASAQARLAQATTNVEYQSEALESQIALRQAEVRNAQAVLDELLAGSRKQDVEQAKAAVERARAEFDTAKRDWERAQALFKDEDISASAHDQAKTRYESASAGLKQAEERLSLVEEGPRSETIDAARAQLRRAQAGLQLAEASRLEVKRSRQEREARASDIAQIKAQLGVIEAQLADTVAVAPVSGVVLVKSAEQGEVVAAGTTIVTLGDIEHPWLRGYIDESDLGRVKLGSLARITTDSYPGKVYTGKVTFISSEAEFTPKQIQTPEERAKLVYRIKVEVENPNQELKLNMPADAEIALD